MKKSILPIIMLLFLVACKQEPKNTKSIVLWQPYNDSAEVAANADHEVERMRYKLIQSKVLDKNEVFLALYAEVSQFSDAIYAKMKPLVLEQDIPSIQKSISEGTFTYEQLVLFYFKRIYDYELPNGTTLNTVIALNPNVLEEARKLDANSEGKHPIYGMPILLKDNIGTAVMKTTAGALALKDNVTSDAFVVSRLKEKGALILGKVNLSEWAYFLCDGCPVGYSAYGGQTLNPYGRRIFETGGSSSGSGTSVAANYAVAAVGTETSGSILSPSSQNSVVGLKPTIGLLSRTGIVPISSTLDTPGPMTKNVTDNAILLDAMLGKDENDAKSVVADDDILGLYMNAVPKENIRLGALKNLMESDSMYNETVTMLSDKGIDIVEVTPTDVELDGFLSILNIDMKNDLPVYLEQHVKDKKAVAVGSVADVIDFNSADSLLYVPYGQARFEGILADSTTTEGLVEIKNRLKKASRRFFDIPMKTHDLDAILSINNWHAGYAAVAEYPALTIPMGYKENGEPISLTFIGKPFTENELLQLGKAYELLNPVRKTPEAYRE